MGLFTDGLVILIPPLLGKLKSFGKFGLSSAGGMMDGQVLTGATYCSKVLLQHSIAGVH